MNYILSDKNNYTHIRFYYDNGSQLTLDRATFESIYSFEIKNAEKVEYLIKTQ